MKKTEKAVLDHTTRLTASSPQYFTPSAASEPRVGATGIDMRSRKAREKFADSLMTLANIIYGALFVGMLLFPLTAFVSAMYNAADPFSFLAPVTQFSWQRILVFAVAFIIPLAAAAAARRKALNLYDALDARESAY